MNTAFSRLPSNTIEVELTLVGEGRNRIAAKASAGLPDHRCLAFERKACTVLPDDHMPDRRDRVGARASSAAVTLAGMVAKASAAAPADAASIAATLAAWTGRQPCFLSSLLRSGSRHYPLLALAKTSRLLSGTLS